MHYHRWERGQPLGTFIARAYPPTWLRIVLGIKRDENGCWIWQGVKPHHGYGQIVINGVGTPTHRASYEAFVGPIPPGLEIDHLCRVTSCANPAHLEPVTHLENMRRRSIARTHCSNGHSVSESYVNVRGIRICRICQRARIQRYEARRKLAGDADLR